MKKRKLLTFGAFLSFLLFSCSYELEEPPPYEATPLDGFGVVDARAYFEEYATDLSYVRFTDTHAHTRSGVLESPELSPDWSRAVRSENGEAVLVEIPIRSELSPVSLVRRYDNGKLRLSRMSIVRVRLIVARRRDGTTQMFIATLVPSVKHSVDERDVENFRYLGGGNFTGTVFCSTLDGHFVEASEYVGGRFAGLLSVTTRRELAENGVSLDEASYESVRLTSGVKTRSGTYSFNEEGEDAYCPFHPTYKQGECPFCLDEVIVRVCRHCGRELKAGESCGCQKPCSYCNRNPCICASDCPYCRPYPCMICAVCGRHFVFCVCEDSGSGGNDGEIGTPGGGNLKDPVTQTSGKATAQKITAAAEKAAKAALAKYGLSQPACNFGVKTAFNEIYSSKELDNKRANDMVDHWKNNPSKWETVEIKDAQRLANEGWFVVAGWKAETGSGHVAVIVPGNTGKGNWNGIYTDLPNAMDTGANMKTNSQLLNRSFGKLKHKNVELYRYK